MSNFLAALQSVAPAGVVPTSSLKTPTPVQKQPEPVVPLQVGVQRILDRGRLDLVFNRKPEDWVLADLKAAGFRYNPADRTWYHKDTAENRAEVTKMFGATFDEVMFDDAGNDAEAELVEIQSEAPVMPQTIEQVSYTPEFVKYREQVNQLIERLQIDPADLLLVAIDCLYRKTFEN